VCESLFAEDDEEICGSYRVSLGADGRKKFFQTGGLCCDGSIFFWKRNYRPCCEVRGVDDSRIEMKGLRSSIRLGEGREERLLVAGPNQSLEPMGIAVTHPADAGCAPAIPMAHH